MKTLKKVHITPIFVEYIPDDLKENQIYISIEHKSSSHKCLCGCGTINILPLHNDGWSLSIDDSNRVTFNPSILNTQCNAHYIIRNNIANFV
jgi:hypothetical protein